MRTAELREHIADLESFSHTIAHDLRAPLRAIAGLAGLLRQDHASRLDQDGNDCIERIEMAAQRLEDLIDQVLQYDKFSRADFPLTVVDVREVIENLMIAHPELHPPKAEVIIETQLPLVLGHEVALTQIVSNLLGNAVKFVAPGILPRVRISAESGAGLVQLRFSDNGIGIPSRERNKLFCPFHRLKAARDYDGSGLGLAIVLRAVRQIGGRIGVNSGPNGGSSFWVEVKAAPPNQN